MSETEFKRLDGIELNCKQVNMCKQVCYEAYEDLNLCARQKGTF